MITIPEDDIKDFRDRLRKYADDVGGIANLAAKADMPHQSLKQTFSRYEPSRKALYKILKAVSGNPSWLFFNIGSPYLEKEEPLADIDHTSIREFSLENYRKLMEQPYSYKEKAELLHNADSEIYSTGTIALRNSYLEEQTGKKDVSTVVCVRSRGSLVSSKSPINSFILVDLDEQTPHDKGAYLVLWRGHPYILEAKEDLQKGFTFHLIDRVESSVDHDLLARTDSIVGKIIGYLEMNP